MGEPVPGKSNKDPEKFNPGNRPELGRLLATKKEKGQQPLPSFVDGSGLYGYMSIPGGPPAPFSFFSGISLISASVVSSRVATLAAF